VNTFALATGVLLNISADPFTRVGDHERSRPSAGSQPKDFYSSVTTAAISSAISCTVCVLVERATLSARLGLWART
jgi:hypothetical protein